MVNQKTRELQKQIEAEKRKMLNCKHDFGKPFYNPEMVKEAFGSKLVVQGSDVWHEPEGYREVEKKRWTRICNNCGFEQHTNKEKNIISSTEPSFD